MIKGILQRYFPVPDVSYKDVGCIDLGQLVAMGFDTLLLDLDNTLVLRKGMELTHQAERLIAEAIRLRMRIAIVSNVVWGAERIERVEAIADQYGVYGVCARFPHLKPSPRPYRFAMSLCSSIPSKSVMVGDQCGTDGRGARKLGIYFVKVEPLGEDHWATRPRRWLERLAGRYN